MVDFKKKLGKKEPERKTDPIEIYNNLDRSSVTGPLRPGQETILQEWYNKRKDDKDLIIKLHTGEGKTLIGLLILLSKLNSGYGPSLYICPNKYLVAQVCAEAAKFGIPYCTFDDNGEMPNDFTEGKKILITHIQKVFNGKSVFGTGNNFQPVKNVILDDSHACIDSIKSSFTIRLPKDHPAFTAFVNLFDSDVIEQGEGTWMDIKSGAYDDILPVPYWGWIDRKSEVLQILSDHKEDPLIKFVWPIVKDRIENCQAFFSGSQIEISPYFVPLHLFSSFNKAEQRILMSATTQDDSFFIKGLGFEVEAIRKPLANEKSLWSGEKMVILPSLIDDELDRNRIVNMYAPPEANRKYGIVALVPSFQKSEYYQQFKAKVASVTSIFDDITVLKRKVYKETLVIANRYDGIDLPDDACRVLIIDSLPVSLSLIDRYEEMCRVNSELINIKVAQKIEQGLGRSVRGEKDYSVILLIGADLVRFVKASRTNKLFSPQTRKQIEIGLEISNDASVEVDAEKITKVVTNLIKQSVARDEDWKEYYIREMNTIKPDVPKDDLYQLLKLERDAENEFYNGRVEKACEIMQKIVDLYSKDDDQEEKGWYMQLLARYKYSQSKTESAKIQEGAFSANNDLLKPIKGVTYKKLEYIHGGRLKRIKDYFKKFSSYEELMLATDGILNNLSFGQRAEIFERALNDVGELIGFVCQRPDKTIKKGPDNLWGGVSDRYFLFECKSEAKEDRTAIIKHEANQMNGHCAWFRKEYGTDTPVTSIMVIETKELSYHGDFADPVVVMRKGNLKKFKSNVKSFIAEFYKYDIHHLEDDTMQGFLIRHQLLPEDIERFTEPIKHQSRTTK